MEGNFSENFYPQESRIGSSLREFRIIEGSGEIGDKITVF